MAAIAAEALPRTKKARPDWMLWSGIVFLLLLVAFAILWPMLGNAIDERVAKSHEPPFGELLLGSDELGRDVMSRLAYGARYSIGIGLAVQLISLVVGIFVGVVGIFGPKWLRQPLLRFTDGMFAFPDILLALLIIGVWKPGVIPVIVALSITSWPATTRLIVTQLASLKDREFVVAARAQGASTFYVVTRHMLPQLWGILLAVSMVSLAGTIISESTLSFLGIGIQPPAPSWGSMINSARLNMNSHPVHLIWPCAILVITIFALNFVGDGLRAKMDPKGSETVTRIVVLGSTGSIGRQTLDVAAQHPDRIQVVGLAAGSNAEALNAQSTRFPQAKTALFEPRSGFDGPTGMNALVDLATLPEADCVVVSVAGVIGLMPTLEAIRAGKRIALASKEVLVAAGEIVMPLARRHGVELVPIDSEHSAIFQCLQGYQADQVEELILTASGGPFRGRTRESLAGVMAADALAHPTWNMGGKITIDSATLMNKGLETIEAKWLFGLEIDRVRIVVHPQSIVHSMVKFRDGSVLGQMGWPDMRLPIQYSLLYPERVPNQLPDWDPVATPNLTFEALDESTFAGPELARTSVRIGGTMPAAMNAANEEAANAFLRGEIRFLEILEAVEAAMNRHQPAPAGLDAILAADQEARSFFRDWRLAKSGAS